MEYEYPTRKHVTLLAKALDQTSPGWAEVIEEDELRLSSPYGCIGGQMWRSKREDWQMPTGDAWAFPTWKHLLFPAVALVQAEVNTDEVHHDLWSAFADDGFRDAWLEEVEVRTQVPA